MTLDFNPIPCLCGGLLLGLSASSNAVLNGRITGISGIIKDVLCASADWRWNLAFLSGLACGGAGIGLLDPSRLPVYGSIPLWRTLSAGLLIGFGSILGSGCTSGHGVCGIARMSPRSFAHVLVFMAVGIATAKVTATAAALAPTIANATPVISVAWYSITATDLELMALAGGLIATLSLVPVVYQRLAEFAHPHKPGSDHHKKHSAKMASWMSHVSAFMCGGLFALGLALGGMTDALKVVCFLDFGATYWSPALMLVMGGAIIAAMPGFYHLRAWKTAGHGPMLANHRVDGVPDPTWKIDASLITGAAIFGLGWGLNGICPAPAIALLGAHPIELQPMLFVVSMFVGVRLASYM